VKRPPPKAAPVGAPSWMWPMVVLVVALFAIGVAGFLYFTIVFTFNPDPVRA
jgi:hypothetical protein